MSPVYTILSEGPAGRNDRRARSRRIDCHKHNVESTVTDPSTALILRSARDDGTDGRAFDNTGNSQPYERDSNLHITETIFSVRDIDAAIRFYTETLGFRLTERQDWGWAVIEDNGQRIGLVLDKWMRDEGAPQEVLPIPQIGMKTDDIEAEVAALRAKGLDVVGPQGEPGATRTATFRDPSGNCIFLWCDT
jgi:catechol 2,3-dioxygenase-like lactoylglutathione lyase family enzyme